MDLTVPKPTPGGLDAGRIARAFEVMLPAHRADLYLQHNPHLEPGTSVSVKAYTSRTSIGFTNELERQKAEKTNEMWILSWRPADEPTGARHISIAACSLSAIAAWLQDNEMAFGN